MAQHNIKNGPSKFDLMMALFDAPESCTSPRKVTFILEDGSSIAACIQSVEAEDGSRESWNLTGWVSGPTPNDRVRYFGAYFSTKRRTGVLTFKP